MINNIDLREHKSCFFGIQESGKTFCAKHYSSKFNTPIVFQVNKDDSWTDVKNMYVYSADRTNPKGLQEEFKLFIQNCHKWAIDGKIDLIIIDEADLFISTNYDIDPYLQDIVLNHRHLGNDKRKNHKGVALWLISRRPQDIPTKIVESSKYLFIFKLEGANAIERFKEINPLLPQLINILDFDRHNFIIKEVGRDPQICAPIRK